MYYYAPLSCAATYRYILYSPFSRLQDSITIHAIVISPALGIITKKILIGGTTRKKMKIVRNAELNVLGIANARVMNVMWGIVFGGKIKHAAQGQ